MAHGHDVCLNALLDHRATDLIAPFGYSMYLFQHLAGVLLWCCSPQREYNVLPGRPLLHVNTTITGDDPVASQILCACMSPRYVHIMCTAGKLAVWLRSLPLVMIQHSRCACMTEESPLYSTF